MLTILSISQLGGKVFQSIKSTLPALALLANSGSGLAQEQIRAPDPVAINAGNETIYGTLDEPITPATLEKPSPWSIGVFVTDGGLPSFRIPVKLPGFKTPALTTRGIEGRVYYAINDHLSFFSGGGEMAFSLSDTYNAAAQIEKRISPNGYGITAQGLDLPPGFGTFLNGVLTYQLPGDLNASRVSQQLLGSGFTINSVSVTAPQVVTGAIIYFRSDISSFLNRENVTGVVRSDINTVLDNPTIIFPLINKYLSEAQIGGSDQDIKSFNFAAAGKAILTAIAKATANNGLKTQILALANNQALMTKFGNEIRQVSVDALGNPNWAEEVVAFAQREVGYFENTRISSGSLLFVAKDKDLRDMLNEYGPFFNTTSCSVQLMASAVLDGKSYRCAANPNDVKNALKNVAEIAAKGNGQIQSIDIVGLRWNPFGGDLFKALSLEVSVGPMFMQGNATASYNNLFMKTQPLGDWFGIKGTGLTKYAVPYIDAKEVTLPVIRQKNAHVQVTSIGARGEMGIGVDWADVARAMGAKMSGNWSISTTIGGMFGLAKAVSAQWSGLPHRFQTPAIPFVPIGSAEGSVGVTCRF